MKNPEWGNVASDFLCLIVAAWLQDISPAPAAWPVKLALLTALAMRFAAVRPQPERIVCVLLAAVFTDALGQLPLFFTAPWFLLLYPAARVLRKLSPVASFLYGLLLCGGACSGQILWNRLWLGASQPANAGLVLWQMLLAFPYGLLAGLSAALLVNCADKISGRTKPEEGNDGKLWAKTD